MRIAQTAALALFASTFAGPADGQQQSVTAGIKAWQSGDYATAVANWRPLAEKGDADAAFNLGQAYRMGRGVMLNLGAAQTWLERAAKADHLDAQTTLGLLLFQNGNRAGGLRWLRVAAERGDPRAMLVYGTALYNGDGVARDPVTAYAYVSRSAAQGLPPAKETLAEMDKVIPVDIRQKGVVVAMDKAGVKTPAEKAPETVKVSPTKATPAKAEPKKAAAAASAPATAVAGTGPWRIQLGAFAQRASAEALFRKLSAKLAGKQAFYIAAGKVTRLQVGPYPSRAAAASACAALGGQACFPVASN
ncbi:MAG TPA: SPOR domain-containing protein [Sphingomicrobium sp.]|nr:SPOR domain-containing protein [Sphingomicrobium sp.]